MMRPGTAGADTTSPRSTSHYMPAPLSPSPPSPTPPTPTPQQYGMSSSAMMRHASRSAGEDTASPRMIAISPHVTEPPQYPLSPTPPPLRPLPPTSPPINSTT